MLRTVAIRAINSEKLLVPRLASSVQKAGLKATYGEKYPYSTPFPYQKKPYDLWRSMFDQTMHRFNENTKIIVVEGNLGVGKADFAKQLAAGFDLKYFGPVSDDSCFIEGRYGMDVRSLNSILPPSCRYYDLHDFYNDPHPEKGRAAKLALEWYKQKYFNYALAMKHLLNTGQGVVLATSVYSDMVYVEALKALRWCSMEFYNYYQDYRANSLCEFYKPHLTIYLDAPMGVVEKRVAEGKPHHHGSPNLTTTYLTALDKALKNVYLPFARKYGEVVEVDWTEKANKVDMDTIIEELQFLKLETEDLDDVKFEDWNRNNDHDYLNLRQLVDRRENLSWYLDRTPCDELTPPADDRVFLDRIFREHPVLSDVPPKFVKEFGYNPMFKL